MCYNKLMKLLKKFICLILPLALIVAAAFTLSACGSAEVKFALGEDGAHYIVQGVEGDKNALKTYEIPAYYTPQSEEGEGETLPVTEIADEAFYGCTSLYKVVIPEGIEKIGALSFMLCNIAEITLPQSLQSIGFGAFAMCSALREITIPENVTEIGEKAFQYCSGLRKVVIECNITELKDGVFENSYVQHAGSLYTSTALKEIHLPASIKKIHVDALEGNIIDDIYFAGTEEQWNEVYFYSLEAKEGEEGEEPVYEEKIVDKSAYFPAQTHIHFGE